MALFKVNRGKSENLPQERHNGWAYFCTDTAEFFIDYEDDSGIIQRKQLNAAEASRLIGYDIVNEINESSEVEIPTAKAILGHLGKYVSLPDRGAIIQLSEALLAALPELADGQQHTIEFTPDEEDTSEILEFQIQSAVQQHNTAVETHTDIRQEIISAKETLTTYVNDSIAAIPTPDVSGQIEAHNVDSAAHPEILTTINNVREQASDNLTTHNVNTEAHGDIREIINTNATTALDNLTNHNVDAEAHADIRTAIETAVEETKAYADEVGQTVKTELLGGAGEAYDTLQKLSDLMNSGDEAINNAIDALEEVAASKTAQTDFDNHVNNKNNPHGVTAAQVGAPTVAEFTAHTTNKENPHGVTASQVGAPTIAEMNAAIAAIPTPDVSGQIGTHNSASNAHSDIRTLISNITGGTTTVSKATTATNATNIYSSASTAKAYVLGTTTASSANHATVYNASVYTSGSVLYGAAWNDYAEYRIADCNEPGRVICENGDDTLSIATERLQPGANVISDTFGFAIGETEEAKTPIAVSGRVLVYTYEDRNEFKAGDAVCAAPNGTVSKMTREEIREYPERIVGVVSAIPNYNTWGAGNVPVNNRIWIKVK